MAYMPYREWVRRLGASPPKRICCFMVRIPRGIQPNTRLRRELRAQLAGSPRFVSAVSILSACPHLSDLTGESPYKRLLCWPIISRFKIWSSDVEGYADRAVDYLLNIG